MTKTVLVLGSAPDAVRARDFDPALFEAIVAINNAWQIRDDWTHLVHAGDFPDEKKPVATGNQKIVSYESYVPANNAFGGIIYAGGTMAFTAAYWALKEMSPDMIAFCGCDMVYNQPDGRSHFYGKGDADPLRKDPTLQSLEAKSNRLLLLALQENCLCVNVSELPESRLTFPRISIDQLGSAISDARADLLNCVKRGINATAKEEAKLREKDLNCTVPTGDYWHHLEDIQSEELARIDQAWLKSFDTLQTRKTSIEFNELHTKLPDFA